MDATQPTIPRRQRLVTLQAGRGIAALMVLAFHARNSQYWHKGPIGKWLTGTAMGVEFFFVLSGVVIFSAHWRDVGQPRTAPSFFWKRFRRVYPIYWLVLIVAVLRHAGAGTGTGTDPKLKFASILSSVLLMPVGSGASILEVGWTLFHEVMFYLLFGLVILSRRIGFVVLALWFACSIAVIGAPIERSSTSFLHPDHLLFAFGIAVAWLLRKPNLPWFRTFFFLGVFIFSGATLAGRWLQLPAWLRIVAGFGAALMMVGAAFWEKHGGLQIPAWLAFLGDASYSIYLVHLLVISGLAQLFYKRWGPVLVPSLLWCGAIAIISLASGIVFYLAVERPLLRWLTRKRGSNTLLTDVR